MRHLGTVEDTLYWKDDDGTVYPALSKCCQGLLIEPLFVTARCSECARPTAIDEIRTQQGQLHIP